MARRQEIVISQSDRLAKAVNIGRGERILKLLCFIEDEALKPGVAHVGHAS